MKLASFRTPAGPSWGLVKNDEIVDLGSALHVRFPDLRAALAVGWQDLQAIEPAPHLPLSEIAWLPVIPNPEKILCIGLNYEEHRRETGRPEAAHPSVFVRLANSQTGHSTDIPLTHLSTELDYEGELAVIIGKPGRYINQRDAPSHIAGYACYNDISVRDWQRHTHQFTPGKNFPATGAFGPWMVTPDEVGELDKLQLHTRVNGQTKQNATFDQMIFRVPRLIEYCSSFTRLEPGDVIVTGTPGGVGCKRQPPFWLKPGDVVEVEIEKVGILRNTIVHEEGRQRYGVS